MAYIFFVAPTGSNVGLTSTCLGLVQALDQIGVRAGFAKPVAQVEPERAGAQWYQTGGAEDPSPPLLEATMGLETVEPLSMDYVLSQIDNGDESELMEEIIQLVDRSATNVDVMVVEGVNPGGEESLIEDLNPKMALALNADVLLVAAPSESTGLLDTPGSTVFDRLNKRIRRNAALFGGTSHERVIGCVINKVGVPSHGAKPLQVLSDVEPTYINEATKNAALAARLPVFDNNFRCLGVVPWDPKLSAPRMLDIQRFLEADVVNEGDLYNRRATSVSLCARQVGNMVSTLAPGSLIVTPGDRDGIFLSTVVATMNGVRLGGVIFTGGTIPSESVMELSSQALSMGLPVLMTKYNSYRTVQYLDSMNLAVPADDVDRIRRVMASVANRLDAEWLSDRAEVAKETRLSPAAFRYSLVERARSQRKRIVLPEGSEPRTVEAAVRSHEKGIADCVMLAPRDEVKRIASARGFTLPADIECVDPLSILDRYIEPMVKLREHKGLTPPMAKAQLEDPVVLGTMMLALDHVDGLVSGAVHTTANTVRPALQLIKTQPGTKIVSSVFFMGLPEQVVVYGDCAINPDPNAEELADIAIQSANSAAMFGIDPRIAMLSYSTGESGSGTDVEKVRKATELAISQRPDLTIDGPLQYDAAAVASVGQSKAPGSPVAGRATVFVFPDLNTGNTTYKAVQRSANVISIGPMLQGLNKPVNDLSRGALVDDILYTIALTAVQAQG